MDPKYYTSSNIENMNKSYPWNGSIKNIITNSTANSNNEFKLVSTGDCNIHNGRQYVAFPRDYVITQKDKEKYNLWP